MSTRDVQDRSKPIFNLDDPPSPEEEDTPIGEAFPTFEESGITSTEDDPTFTSESPLSGSENVDEEEDDEDEGEGEADEDEVVKADSTYSNRSFLHHSNSSYSITNTFAPPFYNRPPTPLPPSPSLTSLLRPSFSTTTSRPTTPDSSENDTPNDTESAVTRSARIAPTVPRASPKVPTYEYYGFVLYLLSSLAFREYSFPIRQDQSELAQTFSSDVPAVVISSVAFPPPARYILLSKSMVVPRYSVVSSHVDYLHLRCSRIV